MRVDSNGDYVLAALDDWSCYEESDRNSLPTRVVFRYAASVGFVLARDGNARRLKDVDAREQLDLGDARNLRRDRRRLWIVAADGSLEISDRHQYVFVDPERGQPLVTNNDLFLLRSDSRRFTLFAPSGENVPSADSDTMRDGLAEAIACACTQPAARSAICDLLMLSSKPGRAHGPTAASRLKRDFARTQLETVVFRLAMMPWMSGEPGTLAALAGSISEGAHPLLPSLFRREYADAAASCFERTYDEFYVREAIASYKYAERQFEAIGMYHQSRATRHNASALQEPLLPGIEASKTSKRRALGFSAARLCGFSVWLNGVPAVRRVRDVFDRGYKCVGDVALSDQVLLTALSGRPSPRQRLVATVERQGNDIAVTTGLFDEMQALLGVGLNAPEHEDVAAIRITCESVRFSGPPWIFRPRAPAVFVGHAVDHRRRHRFGVCAVMLHGKGVRLNFAFDTSADHKQYFSQDGNGRR